MAGSVAESARSHRGLLALVIGLGILILLSVIGLIVGALMRVGNLAPAAGSYAVTLPAQGEHIESTQIDGNRILVRLSGPNGEELVVLDAVTGRVAGRIAVNAKP